MTQTDWHVPEPLLHRLLEEPAAVDHLTASSLEAHLVGCATCRVRLQGLADGATLERSWAAVADRIDRPRTTLGERLLRRLGVDSGLARLLAATPGLRAAGLLAVVGLVAAAVAASRSSDAQGPFLVIAPLAPLLMVGLSFAPADDPAAEAGLATPLHGAALLLRRAFVVLVVTFTVLGLGTLALPGLGPEAAGWVLPALAITLGSFALATWLRTEVAVAALAATWVVAVPVLRWSAGRDLPYADAAPFTAAGQLTAAALALLAAAVLVARRDRLTTLEVLR
jgi:hypothetical protein